MVVINVVFIRPVQPNTFSYVARKSKAHADVALALKRKAVIQNGRIERRNRIQSLADQYLVDQRVAVTEEE